MTAIALGGAIIALAPPARAFDFSSLDRHRGLDAQRCPVIGCGGGRDRDSGDRDEQRERPMQPQRSPAENRNAAEHRALDSLANQVTAAWRDQRWGDAESLYRRAIQIRPGPINYYWLGITLVQQERFDEAEQVFLQSRQAGQVWGDSPGISEKGFAYLNVRRGESQLDEGRLKTAEKYFRVSADFYRSAVEQGANVDERNNGEALALLGRVLYLQGRIDDAEAATEQARSILPETVQWIESSLATIVNAANGESPPPIYKEVDRLASVLADKPAYFYVAQGRQPVQANPKPLHYIKYAELVTTYADRIEEAAARHGVDPDLVRAVIWMESTHGWYDKATGLFIEPKSVQPMNVWPEYWTGLGINRTGVQDPAINIDAGAKILARISHRLLFNTPANIATLYNNLAADKVTEYGQTVNYYLNTKPWLAR